MKLITSPTSPYGRYTRIVVAEKDDPSQCEIVFTDPWDPAAPEANRNPLHKVPILETEGGMVVDSRVIAEELDERMDGARLLPADDAGRTRVRTLAAIASGGTDMGILMVLPRRVDPDMGTPRLTDYCSKKVLSVAAHLGGQIGGEGCLHGGSFTLADAAAACMCGFLDFRFPEVDWRGASASLAEWYGRTAERPSVRSTAPPAA